MKPIGILKVLDLATEARKRNENFYPLFTGDAGLGKSQIAQLFVEEKRKTNPNYGFLDLRIAYLESPDMIGFPSIEKDSNGRSRTTHNLPEFWPTDPNSEGVLLLEEINRGTTGVMNTLMQLLTDRRVHNYELPPKWIIAGCVNPDSAEYDVNAMDAALKNRFVEYEIEYDHTSFVKFMEAKEWDDSVVSFIKSGVWIYREAKSTGRDGKYISPRTWSLVNAARKSGIEKDAQMHFITVTSLLGKDVGNEFHKFCFDESPVTYKDLLENKEAALKKLKEQSDPHKYKGDMIAVTIESIVKNYTTEKDDDTEKMLIGEDTMAAVAKTIPSDQALNLLKQCGIKYTTGASDFFINFTKRYPEFVKILKQNIKITRK